MSKILYISQYYHPENTAGSIRASNVVRELNKRNSIDVLTTYPNHPIGTVKNGYVNKMISLESNEGINVIRVKFLSFKSIKRISAYLSFLFFSIINFIVNRQYFEKEYDYVYVSSGPFTTIFLANFIAKRVKAKVVIEYRDIVYLLLGKSVMGKIIKRIELSAARKSYRTIVVTKSFKKILIGNGVDHSKIFVLSNALNTMNTMKNYNPKNSTNECHMLYMGNLGVSQDILSLVKNLHSKNTLNINIMIVGDGVQKKEIVEYSINKKLQNIKILDPIAYHLRSEMYEKCDVVLIKLHSQKEYGYFIPSKLYDAISFGKKIVYIGPEGETSRLIREYNFGVVCNTDKEFIDNSIEIFQLLNNVKSSYDVYRSKIIKEVEYQLEALKFS